MFGYMYGIGILRSGCRDAKNQKGGIERLMCDTGRRIPKKGKGRKEKGRKQEAYRLRKGLEK